MQIDLEHLHYWMCAIRESQDPMRTMDAFWRGQLTSKEWLITKTRPFVFKQFGDRKITVDIHGGWVGVLASMIFQSDLPIDTIRSIDIDASCESTATMMNKKEEMEGRFKAVTADMCDIDTKADLIINTSCEHITQEQYESWISKALNTSLLVLQSNNYQIPEHVRTANDLEEFKKQCGIDVIWAGELQLPMYTRYMIIGKKNV